jgi:hypothetical protein
MTAARNFLASLSKRSNAEKEIPRFVIWPAAGKKNTGALRS